MPAYHYKCPTCQVTFEVNAARQDFNKPSDCLKCGTSSPRVVTPVGFILKGDGWVGKNQKIKGEMAQKNRRLDVKSKERSYDAPVARLAPNVDGERVESWEEAKKLALAKGKDTSSYDAKIQQPRR